MKKLLLVLLVLSVFTANAQVPSYVPTNGLVAYYPFNGNANDASGNGNNGVVNGATLTSDRNGNVGKAYSFNGANISVPHNSNFGIIQTGQETISLWAFLEGAQTTQHLIGKRPNGAQSFNWQMSFNYGANQGLTFSGGIPGNTYGLVSNYRLPNLQWVNIVGTYSAGIWSLFVNGVLINTTTSSTFYNDVICPLTIGNSGSFEAFSGKLDDIAIYNRALSQSEITSLYNSNSCIANITNNDTSICRGSSITLNAAAVNAASVTDINGNVYPSVNIGTQTWMQKNLNVSKYKNGDIIPQVTNPTQWAALTTGAWCWYNNDSATYAATYGKLYNWYAVNDPRGLAPDGWHVPSDGDWNKLVKYLDANADTTCIGCTQSSMAGGAMKSNTNWNSPNTGATNSSGFSALPGGSRNADLTFNFIGNNSNWWSSNEAGSTSAGSRNLFYINSNFDRGNYSKSLGFSVRALRNTPTYLWSTGATTPSISVSPTVTTKYYCTVSNGVNTCKDSVTVTVSTITTNFITADTIKVCGTSTGISATTGLASYAWSNGANTASTTVTSSGWYKCTATNGACTAKDSVYVSLFNPKITQNDTTVCAGTPLTLTVNNNTALSSSLPTNLRNGLVGYWPFNGNANDESGNGNNGTVNGATLTSDRFGNVGKAYSFNGVNNWIQTLNPGPNGSGISVNFWYKANSNLFNCYMGYGGDTWGSVFEIMQNYWSAQTTGPCFGPSFHNWGSLISKGTSQSFDLNSWHNVIVILPLNSSNINDVIIYFDGVQKIDNCSFANYGSPAPNIGNSKPIRFGRNWITDNGDLYFNGKLDDISIYNRALSANEVQQLYSGVSSYIWSTTATTQSINVTPTATTSYIATVSNGINTCKDTVKITVANITSLSPSTIFGAVDVCAAIGADTASIPVNYKINKVANAASYVWTVPAGATLLSGQGDTSIMVRFRSSFVSGAITVKSVSICNISSAVKSVTVYKRVAAAPTSIQNQFSPTSIVAVTNVTGSVSQIYRIKKVLYASSYNWYLNRGTNATITHVNPSGVNDTAVIVTFASCFVKDTLSVKSVSPCAISAAKTVIMSSSTTPTTVAGITTVGGDFAVCIGSSKTFTAIASTPTTTQVGIARYRWTKPLNTVITSATTDSSSITLSFNTGFTGGNLTCKGISACGVVGTTASTAILQYLPPTPLSIGSSTNSYNACINSSVTYTALLVSAPTTAQATATVFRWTKPNNTTITAASADSSSITVRFNTGYTGGVISVKGQTRCGTQSAARSQSLTHTGCALGTKMSLPITTTNTASFEVSLYPNPSTNEFKLLIKNNAVVGTNKPTKAIIKVIDLQGRMMKSFTTNTNQVTAIGNELKAGVYMVEVRLGDEVKVIRAVKF